MPSNLGGRVSRSIIESVNDWISSLTDSDLKMEFESRGIYITGTYHANYYYEKFEQELVDLFKLKIYIPMDYPEELPKIQEIEGRIPKDFHMNNNSFCLEVPIEMYLYAKDHSINEFLSKFLDSYLSAFMWYKKYGFFPYGDRSHGTEGKMEQLLEFFNVKSPNTVIELLSISTGSKYKRNDLCPCGSGKKYKSCHLNQVEMLMSKVPIDELIKTCKELIINNVKVQNSTQSDSRIMCESRW